MFSTISFGQVEQKVVVEHFTNTNCGICGSRNPGLFKNLANENADVIHISYYPSRPYSDCKLNNHNSAENDTRTKYYGIYGSTPQIVIQGEPQSRPDFTDPKLFDDYKKKLTAYQSKTKFEIGTDSIYVRVALKSDETDDWTDIKMLVMAIEDTVFYKGRNSEKEHYNVFRKSFTVINGVSIDQNLSIGDSVVFYFSIPIHTDWNLTRVKTLTLLQNGRDKTILQAENGTEDEIKKPVGIDYKNNELVVYPTVATHILNINSEQNINYNIFSISGKVVAQGKTAKNITISSLESGIYFLQMINGKTSQTIRFIKE